MKMHQFEIAVEWSKSIGRQNKRQDGRSPGPRQGGQASHEQGFLQHGGRCIGGGGLGVLFALVALFALVVLVVWVVFGAE